MGKGEEDYARQHIARIDTFALQVQKLYFQAVAEAIRLGMSVKHDKKKAFKFSDYPVFRERVNKMLADLATGVAKVISAGSESEWMLAEQKNDALVRRLFGENMPKALEDRFLARNLEALRAFQSRKVEGLSLSRRVWNHTHHFKNEMEMALDVAIADGRSAQELSRDVRKYLEEPDMLFRRVRDVRGQLHLSKNAALYHPGQGKYRSSYKNAMRMARTETNMAYREADFERWQSLDFIVGMEIKRSNHPYDCPTCGPLAGTYPKQFKFRGWHPQCRCYAVAVLATAAERDRMAEMILNGQDPGSLLSANVVDHMPGNYTSWILQNEDRLLRAKSLPYFIKDNYSKSNSLGLSLG